MLYELELVKERKLWLRRFISVGGRVQCGDPPHQAAVSSQVGVPFEVACVSQRLSRMALATL